MNVRHRFRAPLLLSLLLMAVLGLIGLGGPAAWAGPVSWQEVTASAEGRQWWDSGSLRLDRSGQLSVLSRFQPAAGDEPANTKSAADRRGALYVMQLDCDGQRWRDVAVNGLPRLRASWQPAGADELTDRVLQEACQAAGSLKLAARVPAPA